MMERERGLVIQTIGRETASDTIVAGPSSKWISAWSPDGQLLAFADLTPASSRLWTVPARPVRTPTLYREAPYALGALQFSPDGRRVAYMSHESGRFEVYVDSYPDARQSRSCFNRRRQLAASGVRTARELYYLGLDRT